MLIFLAYFSQKDYFIIIGLLINPITNHDFCECSLDF